MPAALLPDVCPKCGKPDSRNHHEELVRWPNTLIVQVKRWKACAITGSATKIAQHLSLPEELGARAVADRCPASPKYNLKAVVMHHGSFGGGHYMTVALHSGTGNWEGLRILLVMICIWKHMYEHVHRQVFAQICMCHVQATVYQVPGSLYLVRRAFTMYLVEGGGHLWHWLAPMTRYELADIMFLRRKAPKVVGAWHQSAFVESGSWYQGQGTGARYLSSVSRYQAHVLYKHLLTFRNQ